MATDSKIASVKNLPAYKCLALIEKRSIYQYYVNLLLPKHQKEVKPFTDFHREFLLHSSNKVFNKYLESSPVITEYDLDYVSKKCYSYHYNKKNKTITDDSNTNMVCYKRLNELINMISTKQKLSIETKDKIIGNVYISSRHKKNADSMSWIRVLFNRLGMEPVKFNPINHLLSFSVFSQFDDHDMEKILPLIDNISKLTYHKMTMDNIDLKTKNRLLSNFLESSNIGSKDVPILMDKLKINDFNGTDALQFSIKKNDYDKTIYLLNYSKIKFNKLTMIHSTTIPQLTMKVVEKMEQTLGHKNTKSILEKNHVMFNVALNALKDCGEEKNTCHDKWDILLKYLTKFDLKASGPNGVYPHLMYQEWGTMNPDDFSY